MSTTRLIIGGSGQFVIPIYKKLKESSFDICAFITQPDSRQGRGQVFSEQEIVDLVDQTQTEVVKPLDINSDEVKDKLKSFEADLFLTASYGQFLDSKLLDLFAHGCWNLHPSLLPKYRGAAPVNWAIKNGDSQTGVSLFKMVKQMDAGPIAAQATIDIDPHENANQLLQRCAQKAGDLAILTIPKIISGNTTFKEQDEDQATFAPKMDKECGHINWDQPCETVFNQMRAVVPWPKSYGFINKKRFNFFKSNLIHHEHDQAPGTIIDVNNQNIVVACQKGSISIGKIQKQGKRAMNIREFLNGTKLQVNDQFN